MKQPKYPAFVNTLLRNETLWTSLLALYLELMMLRLHASYFQLFSYFKNISLLSCFLGLGLGFAYTRRRPVKKEWIFPLFALQALLLHALSVTPLNGLLQNPLPENLTLGMQSGATLQNALYSVIFLAFFFLINAFCFIPLGRWISESMEDQPKTKAYEANLLGSLLGIGVLTLLSWSEAPPLIWLILPALLIMFLRRRNVKSILIHCGCIALLSITMTLPMNANRKDFYSPYQLITLMVLPDSAPHLLVSHAYYQRILDLRPEKLARGDPKTASAVDHYNLPYQAHPKPERVLILGSGTGNDVAAALRNGAAHVDAVEIDPVILRLGRALHPERPYQSDRVTAHATDGRLFLHDTKERYDLIVYGLLDSHALLSGLSSVRLDSYIYTVDAFRELKEKLKPGGTVCLSFCIIHPALAKKLYLMITQAFDGQAPQAYLTRYDLGVAFVIGRDALARKKWEASSNVANITNQVENLNVPVSLSTDNWPFLYMPQRKYPFSFLITLGLLFVLTLGVTYPLGFVSRGRFSGFFFSMGAGFMLIETTAITRMALQFGNTWLIVSWVISGVLILAFLANRCVIQGWSIPESWVWVLLFASLFLSYGLSSAFFPSITVSRGLAILQLLPIFFSGYLFSTSLNRAPSAGYALGSNVLGALFGGFLEYNAMLFGFRALILHSVILYLIAYLLSRKTKLTPQLPL